MRTTLLLTAAAFLVALAGCSNDDDPAGTEKKGIEDPAFRGELTSSANKGQLGSQLLAGFIASFDLDTALFKAQYDVEYHTVTYKSVDWDGNEVEVGGGIWIPLNSPNPVRLACYSHGTSKGKAKGPSQVPGVAVNFIASGDVDDQVLLGALLASTMGYAVMHHDYLGLGHSEGIPAVPFHPYQHAETEAYSGIDGLRATRTFIEQQGLTEADGGVFLFGYSQGGHATAAMQQQLEAYHTDEFEVFAAAPLSGPYDLDESFVDLMLSPEEYSRPMYLPYVLFSYNLVYELYDQPSDFIKPEFADDLYALFLDPNVTLNPIDQFMRADPINAVPIFIVRDDVKNEFINDPNHPLREILTENDMTTFAPQAPVIVVSCSGDTQVPSENADIAAAAWRANGAPYVVKKDGGNLDHNDCVLPAMTFAKEFIDSLEAL